jgi:hypothetical protein
MTREGAPCPKSRKIAAILVSDVVGCSRLAGPDRTLARLRALRSDLIDPTISVHRGRVVKRICDGSVIEFRSVVAAVRCAGTVIIFALCCMTAFALINEAFGLRFTASRELATLPTRPISFERSPSLPTRIRKPDRPARLRWPPRLEFT